MPKERLFAEVVAHTMKAPNIITAEITKSRSFAKNIAAALSSKLWLQHCAASRRRLYQRPWCRP
jgi:hypothetical protein